MCTCKDENNTSCSCRKKWLWIGFGLLALGGLIWWYFKKKNQAG